MPDEAVLTADQIGELPPELIGKTVREIAEYFSRREQILTEQASARQLEQQKPADKPDDEKIDMFNDPAGSVNRVVSKKVREEVDRVSAAASPAIINACRIAARDKYKDYDRFAPEIEKRMRTMNSDAQMNPAYWEYTYKIVKGENADRLIEEAVTRARNPVEKPTPSSPEASKPRALTPEEKSVAAKMGMSEDRYRKAAERYESEDGKLPLTTDSANARQKAG